MSAVRPVRRALLAVYDKAGIVELARGLADRDVEIVSSGGTATTLRDAGVTVTPVEDVTGFPEMLGGRVKTLHPRIHAGILADRRKHEHDEELARHAIEPFDLVVVNLYPFRETVSRGGDVDEVIENIDIGGPAMVRAAAKNHASVAVVVDPASYRDVLREIGASGGVSAETRRALAAEAFAHTAAYDVAVAGWFAQTSQGMALAPFVGLSLEKVTDLRYGENPHQRGALYRNSAGSGVLDGARVVIEGKEMSFNNWLDVDAAFGLVADLPETACVIVKHNSPCGAAVRDDPASAYAAAFESDQVSAFGGIVAFNVACDERAVDAMREVFTEVVVAPSFSDDALAALGDRKSLRVVEAPLANPGGLEIRAVRGGALVQDRDDVRMRREDAEVVSAREPSEEEWADLMLAWTVAARVRSNAIVLVNEGATVGVGAGQMSRVDAAWLAARKAGDRAKGAAMASDAFFPFADAVEVAADAGVTAIIHPGGSIRDEEVLAVAEARGMAVVVTGRRHFRH